MTSTLITIVLTISAVVLWIQTVQPHRAAAESQPVNSHRISGNDGDVGSTPPRRNPDHASGIRGSADVRFKLKRPSFVAFRE